MFIVLNYIIVADSDAIKNNTPLFPVSSISSGKKANPVISIFFSFV